MMQPDRSETPKRAAIYARSYQLKAIGLATEAAEKH
jgi:hypothetical protein